MFDMPGKICEVIDGVDKGKHASVNKDQESQVVALGKVHVFFYDENDSPLLQDGRHVNGLISLNKLSTIGFYD